MRPRQFQEQGGQEAATAEAAVARERPILLITCVLLIVGLLNELEVVDK